MQIIINVLFFSESVNTCADDIATVATDTFVFGSKSSLTGSTPALNYGAGKAQQYKTAATNFGNKGYNKNGEFQIDRRKNVEQLTKNELLNNRRSSFSAASSSSFGGSALSHQAKKPWFIATRDDSSLDEMKELNLSLWKARRGQPIDKDVLY